LPVAEDVQPGSVSPASEATLRFFIVFVGDCLACCLNFDIMESLENFR
jgi:hypothetical protein